MADRNPLFAQGLSRPPTANGHGGLMSAIGDEYLIQLVETMCADCENDNPFQQDLGVGIESIFGLDHDNSWRAMVKRRLEREFKKLKDANLATFSDVEFKDGVEGEQYANVKFRSIETNTELEVKTKVRSV